MYVEEWWGCPLVVHYWADLQSVHGLRYENIAPRVLAIGAHGRHRQNTGEREMSASTIKQCQRIGLHACTRFVPG